MALHVASGFENFSANGAWKYLLLGRLHRCHVPGVGFQVHFQIVGGAKHFATNVAR